MHSRPVLLAATLALLATAADAQPPGGGAPPRVHGTVQSLQGKTLVLLGADGKSVTVTLAADASIQKTQAGTLADLKPGEFVGCTSVLGSDGRRHAQEVHIILQRGLGEGHHAMGGEQTMTNGNVDGVVSGTQGETVTIGYKGGAQKIIVEPGTPVTTMVPVDAAALRPGAEVNAMLDAGASGGREARNIMIGKLPSR